MAHRVISSLTILGSSFFIYQNLKKKTFLALNRSHEDYYITEHRFFNRFIKIKKLGRDSYINDKKNIDFLIANDLYLSFNGIDPYTGSIKTLKELPKDLKTFLGNEDGTYQFSSYQYSLSRRDGKGTQVINMSNSLSELIEEAFPIEKFLYPILISAVIIIF